MSALARFPALQRLRTAVRTRRVPVVLQRELADCGAACLCMALQLHGRDVRLADVREACGASREGTDAGQLLIAAERHGLRARGVRLDIDDLEFLPPGSILHWQFTHFVVLERSFRGGVDIVDPASGRRRVTTAELREAFTGVAVELRPGEAPTDATTPTPSSVLDHIRGVAAASGAVAPLLTMSALVQLLALAVPLLTGVIVDQVVPRSDHALLWTIAAGMAAIVGFQALASLIRGHLLLHLRTNLDVRVTTALIGHLVALPYAFFQRHTTGDLMLRINSTAVIRELLASSAMAAVLDAAMVVLYLALLLAFSPALAALAAGLGLAQLVVFAATRRRYQELMAHHLEAQMKAQSHLVQLVTGIEVVKTAGAEERLLQRWSNLYVDELNVSLRRGRLGVATDAILGALRAGSPLLLLVHGAAQVLDGALSLGEMLALNALALGFLAPLATLLASGLQLSTLRGYVDRVDDVLAAPGERRTPAPFTALRGAIGFDRVAHRYAPDAPFAVDDVSFQIPAGATVAIVGGSGSGKSTLAGLLLGLHTPTRGSITFDGHDLRALDLQSVRAQIGAVPQHPFLFAASFRDNITLHDSSIPTGAVLAAARLACIHDDIVRTPMGYHGPIAAGGASLSGGQRQRIALARALVREPPILLLDEATSALDTETEARVTANLDTLRCTRILIAHRLSTIVRADIILVMQDGHLVERGDHESLLAARGTYWRLVSAQLRHEGRAACA